MQEQHIFSTSQSLSCLLAIIGGFITFIGVVFWRYADRNDSDHALAREQFDSSNKRFDEIEKDIVAIKTEHNMNHRRSK